LLLEAVADNFEVVLQSSAESLSLLFYLAHLFYLGGGILVFILNSWGYLVQLLLYLFILRASFDSRIHLISSKDRHQAN